MLHTCCVVAPNRLVPPPKAGVLAAPNRLAEDAPNAGAEVAPNAGALDAPNLWHQCEGRESHLCKQHSNWLNQLLQPSVAKKLAGR